jgi:hypothetical protein
VVTVIFWVVKTVVGAVIVSTSVSVTGTTVVSVRVFVRVVEERVITLLETVVTGQYVVVVVIVLVVKLVTMLVDSTGDGVIVVWMVTGAVVRGGLGMLEVTGGGTEDGVWDGHPCGHDVMAIVLVVRLV